jgi:hypothetical protein
MCIGSTFDQSCVGHAPTLGRSEPVANIRVDQFKPCSGEGFERQNAPAEMVAQVTAAPVARARGDLVTRRSTVLARLVAIVCTFGACSRAAQPLRVVERLVDHPIVPGAGDAAVLAAHVPNRWTAADIEERWVHVAGRRAMTFRSPRLDVARWTIWIRSSSCCPPARAAPSCSGTISRR